MLTTRIFLRLDSQFNKTREIRVQKVDVKLKGLKCKGPNSGLGKRNLMFEKIKISIKVEVKYLLNVWKFNNRKQVKSANLIKLKM